jgi:hypothetical protein
LANGGILERCRVKVNLKRIFFYVFYALASSDFKRQKDQQITEKTLAAGFNENESTKHQKVDQMVKIYISATKNKRKVYLSLINKNSRKTR